MDQKATESSPAAAIRDHWLTHRCLPFPADGLVPREFTEPDSGGYKGSIDQTLQAAAFAGRLLASDAERVEKAHKTRKSPLTSLTGQAAASFATRHPDFFLRPGTKVKSGGLDSAAGKRVGPSVLEALRLVDALITDADRKFGPSWTTHLRWQEAQASFTSRLAALEKPRQMKATARLVSGEKKTYPYDYDGKFKSLPFGCQDGASQGYQCACQPDFKPFHIPQLNTSRSADELGAVKRVLELRGSEWWLMSRLFLSALHGHLGWMPYSYKAGKVGDSQLSLHRMAVHLLRQRMLFGKASAEAALASGLLQGFAWRPPGDEAVAACRELPALLVDLVPQPLPAWSKNVMAYLGRAALGHDFFESELAPTVRLAREVAADLTSPKPAAQAGAQPDDWKGTQARMTEVDSAFVAELIKRDRAARRAKVPAIRRTEINAAYVRNVLMPRKKVIASFFGWMHSRGHAIVEELLKPATPNTK